jgi:arylsulfatase A-like enzyme
MRRESSSRLFRFILFSVALSGSLQIESAASAHERPNIVVIFTDDQTYRAAGYHNPAVKTPHLDALASSGVTFERAYVASPICAASRASMMTGLFPQQHGVIALSKGAFSRYQSGGQRASETLPARLKKAGYLTAFFGKSHLGKPRTYGFEIGDELPGHDDVKTFEEASKFIEATKGAQKPFLLWLAPRQPHVPLFPNQKWLDLYPEGSLSLPRNYRIKPTIDSLNNQGTPGKTLYRDSNYRNNVDSLPSGPPRDEKTMLEFMQAYYAVVSHLDDQVGKFAGLLRESGLMENTVVFFLSDNGYHLGSHGLGNKITMHEESVRVPMFAYGEGIPTGKTTRALVSSLDLYPTILELAGVPLPSSIMGKSLLPLLENRQASHRDTVFSECVGVGGKRGDGHRMARGDRWKLILSDQNEEFLFDQQADPFELQNRISDPKLLPVLQGLRNDLAHWMKEVGDRPYPSPESAGDGE